MNEHKGMGQGVAVTEQELERRVRQLEHDVSWLRRTVKAVIEAIKSAAGQLRKIDLPDDNDD